MRAPRSLSHHPSAPNGPPSHNTESVVGAESRMRVERSRATAQAGGRNASMHAIGDVQGGRGCRPVRQFSPRLGEALPQSDRTSGACLPRVIHRPIHRHFHSTIHRVRRQNLHDQAWAWDRGQVTCEDGGFPTRRDRASFPNACRLSGAKRSHTPNPGRISSASLGDDRAGAPFHVKQGRVRLSDCEEAPVGTQKQCASPHKLRLRTRHFPQSYPQTYPP